MKKKIIKPLLTVIPLSTSLLMNIGTASAEDIYIEVFMLMMCLLTQIILPLQ